MSTVVELDDLLSQAGADLGKPEKRQQRAARLCAEGMSASDLSELVEWAHSTRRKLHTVGTWIQWATRQPNSWRAVLHDVRKLQAARAARQEQQPNMPAPAQRSAEDEAARVAGMAYCRVVSDRRTHEEVAVELGLDVARVAELVQEQMRRRGLAAAHAASQRGTKEDVW